MALWYQLTRENAVSLIRSGLYIASLTKIVSAVATLNEVLTGTERVLETPLPAAYTIAISQITWVYVLLLPFQLFSYLGWITIPGSIGNNSLIYLH